MKPETIAIHGGSRTDKTTGAVIEPIVLSTTFERNADGGYDSGYNYSRSANPNRASLEKVLALLEGGTEAACFASGSAAGMTVFQALKPGTHIIAPDDMYHGMRHLLKEVFVGILEYDFVDMTDEGQIKAHIKPHTGLIWIETPSNPLLKITDIQKVVAIAKRNNLKTVCDNTFASPICQQPIAMGVDVVMHSSTKYFGGHSDIMGGVLIAKEKDEWWAKMRMIQAAGGAIPSPMDCYYLTRSIKTLPYRVKAHCQNAQALAEYLERHPNVEQVLYPGLKSHPQHELAIHQMSGGFGGVLSFTVKNEQTARKVVNSTHLFAQATSLGGVESLIEHRASIEGPDTKTPANLIRVSVGLEHIDDLIDDLNRALEQ